MDTNQSIFVNTSGVEALTAWASSYYRNVSDRNKAILDFLCPTVPVAGGYALFTEYDRLSAFELQNTLSPPEGGFRKVNPKGTMKEVNMEQHGLLSTIYAKEKMKLQDGAISTGDAIVQRHLAPLRSGLFLSAIKEVVDLWDTLPKTSVAWRNPSTATPIQDLLDLREKFEMTNDVMPNRLFMNREMFNLIQNADTTKTDIQYNNANALTKELLKKLLNYGEDDDLEIMIANVPYNTGNGTENKSLVGSRVCFFYAQQEPTLDDQTGIKMFLGVNDDLLGTMASSIDPHTKNEDISLALMRQVVVTAPESFQQLVIAD